MPPLSFRDFTFVMLLFRTLASTLLSFFTMTCYHVTRNLSWSELSVPILCFSPPSTGKTSRALVVNILPTSSARLLSTSPTFLFPAGRCQDFRQGALLPLHGTVTGKFSTGDPGRFSKKGVGSWEFPSLPQGAVKALHTHTPPSYV